MYYLQTQKNLGDILNPHYIPVYWQFQDKEQRDAAASAVTSWYSCRKPCGDFRVFSKFITTGIYDTLFMIDANGKRHDED